MPRGKPTGKGIVYGLLDPRDEQTLLSIRYVGYTADPDGRLKAHITEAKTGRKTHRLNWVRKLLKAGVEPVMMLLTKGTGLQLAGKEVSWVRKLKKMGCKLVNGTDGGEGVRGLVYTPEMRENLSKLGKKHAKEMSNRAKAMWADPEFRVRHSGDNHHMKKDECRVKVTGYRNGMVKKGGHSKKTKKQIGDSLRGIPRTEQAKKAISTALRGKSKSEDHRKALSKARLSTSKKVRQRIRKLYDKGLSCAEIARQTEVHYMAVYRVCKCNLVD